MCRVVRDIQVGIDIVDRQHQIIFEKANEINDAVKDNSVKREEVLGIMKFMEDYIIKHFLMEEALMRNTFYVNFPQHKAQHDKFNEKVKKLKENYISSGYQDVYVFNLVYAISDWLFRHISVEDKKIGKHLADRNKNK